MDSYNLCIVKPNDNAFSETFVADHIKRLAGNKKVIYGGAFPVYDHHGKYLIKSKIGLLSYLIQKRIFKKLNIEVRTRALIQYFKEENIDVVFAEYGMVGGMITKACKTANVPLIIHFHGADVHHQPTVAKYLEFYKEAFSYASAFIAVSGDMVEELKKLGAPPNRIHQLSCGVDVDLFPKIDISESEKLFLSVGRFVEKKSPKSLVKAFKYVADEFSDAKLIMVGDGPLFNETKQLIEEMNFENRIILKGILNSTQIKELIGKSRSFIQHSVTAKDGDKEGTPVTILEAGSSGLAIVSTKHAGIKEAVINNETGFLVEEHNIKAMADCMIKIASDIRLAISFGDKEAEYIRKNYDIRDRIVSIDGIIQKAIKND